MFKPTELKEIKELLLSKKKIVILTHFNPDGDAIGSSLALHLFLEQMRVSSQVIIPNEFPKFLKWMPGSKSVVVGEYRDEFSDISITEADIIFCLDFNSSARINNLQEYLDKTKGVKILIDHHQQPDSFDYMYSDTQQPATCQMIYKFIEALGEEDKITKDIAECIYTGILTDTGSFRFRNTTEETHKILAKCLEKGVYPDVVASNLFDHNSLSRVKLLARVLDTMELIEDKGVAILRLTRKEMEEFNYQKGDTDGFVNYGLSISGINFVGFFIEDLFKEMIKISFRSKGDIDVSAFSREHFEGGGHTNASGGKSDLSLEETIARFKKIIKNEA